MIGNKKYNSETNQNKKTIVVFIFKIFIVFVSIFVMDMVLGVGLKNMYFNVKSGRYKKLTYVLNKTNQDILIFGSSHAECHFIPKVFSDTTGLSCYNAGFRSQYLLFLHAIHKAILARYNPKLVIINIDPGMFDEGEKDYQYQIDKLSELLPYIRDNTTIKKALLAKGILEQIKQLSNCYCYNSVIIYLLKYYFSMKDNFVDGYYPLVGKIQKIGHKKDSPKVEEHHYKRIHVNPNLVAKFYEIVDNFRMRGVAVVAVISPSLGENIVKEFNTYSVLKKKGVFTLDYRLDSVFSHDSSLFFDAHHLNESGAKQFSSKIVNDLLHHRELKICSKR